MTQEFILLQADLFGFSLQDWHIIKMYIYFSNPLIMPSFLCANTKSEEVPKGGLSLQGGRITIGYC